MSGHPQRGKLLGVSILLIIVLGGVAAYFAYNRTTSTLAVSLTSTTSEPVQTTSAQTLTSTASSPSLTQPPAPVQWITVGNVRSIGYYLNLLASNGIDTYSLLAQELRKLSDLTNATAVAAITYLALNATNPEVKEAFQLMINGGTPGQSDYSYPVPSYNTELEVLYWLACQNQFKKDDTLALAIAMDNGIWVTIGDNHVISAVRNDTSSLLTFFRETDELQEQRGYYPLEKYPLEAKVTLAWTGGLAPMYSRYNFFEFQNNQLFLTAYYWDAVNVTTLRNMREIMDENGWITHDAEATFDMLEDHFYFTNGISGDSTYWGYTTCSPGTYSGYTSCTQKPYYGNMNEQFTQYFLKMQLGYGSCEDETEVIDSWSKAWGIASNAVWSDYPNSEIDHVHSIVYDPKTQTWRAYEKQLDVWYHPMSEKFNLRLFIPPILQRNYLPRSWNDIFRTNASDRLFPIIYKDVTGNEIKAGFICGVPTSQMKHWVFYS